MLDSVKAGPGFCFHYEGTRSKLPCTARENDFVSLRPAQAAKNLKIQHVASDMPRCPRFAKSFFEKAKPAQEDEV